MTRSIAVAHKDFDTRGGGEVFARRIAEHLDAPLYVGRRNLANEPDTDIDIREIPLSWLDKHAIDHGGLPRTVAYMFSWQYAASELADYDVVVASGNEPMWYVPPDDQTVIAYTHSTPRYMYDLYHDRVQEMGRVGVLIDTAKRVLYQHNTPRPDRWVCNSDLVARRVTRYHHVDPEDVDVVYPPVDTHHYAPDAAATEDYYLHLGRLADVKRIDELVAAFRGLDTELKIAGEGPERDRLEPDAPGNVEFLGYVSEDEKRELMSAAKAHVYNPENEDFGMVPIESMAAGTPVVGVDEGFTHFQVLDGENGVTYQRGVDNLRDAVRRFEQDGVAWTPDEIAGFAENWFGVTQFEGGMDRAIEAAVTDSEVSAPWQQSAGVNPDEEPPSVRLSTDGGNDDDA